MKIRPERAGDEAAIVHLIEAAFRDVEHSDGSEPRIVDCLRAAGDLTLSLVAEVAGESVGHAAFSPVTIGDGSRSWYGLAPVAVLPSWQGQGIGAALIRRGIAQLQGVGAKGIVVLGEPAYYGRFDFEHDPHLVYPGLPAEYFQRLVLAGEPPRGQVRYAPAFG